VTDWLVGRCQCAGNQEAVKEVARNLGRLGVLRDGWYEASEPVINSGRNSFISRQHVRIKI